MSNKVSDHPFTVTLGIAAAVAGLVMFLTGKDLPTFFNRRDYRAQGAGAPVSNTTAAQGVLQHDEGNTSSSQQRQKQSSETTTPLRAQEARDGSDNRLAQQLLAKQAAEAAVAQEDRAIQPDGQKRLFVNQDDGLTYAWIPPGRFLMGCAADDSQCNQDEKPAHYVTMWDGFRIGTTEVTQEAYRKVMGRLPQPEEFGFPPDDLQATFDSLTGQTPGANVGHKLPVEYVKYEQAEKYCEKIGMRLPTEAEWEYAARGGTTGVRYGDLDAIAWWGGNHKDGSTRVHEVGLKDPNAYGLYDMLGNVREWTSDKYPNDWQESRVVRGGDWADNSRDMRVSARDKDTNIPRGGPVGFRCVRPMPEVKNR